MLTCIIDYEATHLLGENATYPIAPPDSALAALLILAGRSQRRRRALPGPCLTAHSGASNCRI